MKKLFLMGVCLFGISMAAHAQSATPATQVHQNDGVPAETMTKEAQDAYLHPVEVAHNELVTKKVTAERIEAQVRLAHVKTEADARAFDQKLAGQPGILSVSTNYITRICTVVYKADDEHNALLTYFDIQ